MRIAAPEVSTPTGVPRRYQWLFRLLAAGLVLLPLVLLELGLRAGSFGHPASFFLPREIGGKAVLVENPWFGLSFFPPAQVRSPSPLVVQNPKPNGVCRIFLFGESAAMGDPRPAYGMGRCLEALLRARFPEQQFEVVCVGTTAINSHGLLPIARECARYEGDLWIIYTGHNEFVGPFGANTVFGPAAPPNWAVRLYLALQRTRTGQLLMALARRLNHSANSPTVWGGMRVFLDQQVSPADPRKERIYASFRRNMEDIMRVARRWRVPVVLCGVASNLKDCAPFASVHAPALEGPRQAEWERRFQTGLTNLERGDFTQALEQYRAAAQLSPLYAEGHFRLGQSLLEMTNADAAAESFRRARDSDSLLFRADTAINRIIREVAGRYAGQGVVFLDAEAALAPLGTSHVTGDECFYEHVHLNFEGNYQLARALAQKAVDALPRRLLGGPNPSWEDAATCAGDLGLTDWNRCTILEDIEKRISDAPFTNQADHAVSLRKLEMRLTECKGRLRAQAVRAARLTYQQAIQKRPRDHWLHHNYAEFLAAIGDLAQAAKQMRMVCDLVPQHYSGHFQLGRLLARQGHFEEAAKAFEAALAARPDSGDIYVELGQVRVRQGRFDEALQAYLLAGRSNVDPARICLLRAQVFDEQQKPTEAVQSLRAAIRLRPAYWEAHERLGLELALQGNFHEAGMEFEEVVRLRPDSAEGHLNLGITLARQGQLEEALAHFEATRRLEPQNKKAREFIEAIQQRQK
jgi:tetratricopeptide (TPR) repeat protein